jgi:hypothetical protein
MAWPSVEQRVLGDVRVGDRLDLRDARASGGLPNRCAKRFCGFR